MDTDNQWSHGRTKAVHEYSVKKMAIDMEYKKARKKPIEIEYREPIINEFGYEEIYTREGTLRGYHGKDYVILGIEGELYPIKIEIFNKTYDIIESENLDNLDKDIIEKLREFPHGISQRNFAWNFEDRPYTTLEYRFKSLANKGYIRRESARNNVILYPNCI